MQELGKQLSENGFTTEMIAVGSEWRAASVDLNSTTASLVPSIAYKILPATGRLYKISVLILSLLALLPLVCFFVRRNPSAIIVGLNPLLTLGALLLSFRHPVVILSVQGLPRNNRFRRRVWGWIVRRSDAVVVPSDEVHQVLANLGVETEVRVIQNPVLTSRVVSQSDEEVHHEWFDDPELKVVIGVGRLTYQKNFSLLIRAFSRLSPCIDKRLIILGEGEQRAELEALIDQLELNDRVDMPGYVKNPIAFMARSDVFVLSSRWEGPGHVLIEAMSTGVACVSVECPGGPISILRNGQHGLISKGFDEISLAENISQALSGDPDISNKAQLGKLSTKQYDSKTIGERYANLVTKLLAEGDS